MEPESSEVREAIARCRRALAEGRTDAALRRLHALAAGPEALPVERYRIGRMVASALRAADVHGLRLLLGGRVTTTWLAPALAAAAWADHAPLTIDAGGFDTVLQDLERVAEQPPEVVVLLPWHRDLLAAGERTAEQRVGDDLDLWRRAWSRARAFGARVVQVGYDWTDPGSAGFLLRGSPGSAPDPVTLVRRMNEALRAELASTLGTDAAFVDLPLVAGDLGRESFYDPRRWAWTKQPLSEPGTIRLAHHLWAAVRALTTGPKKVLVVDLDDTLWGGVVGELGGAGVALGDSPEGEAFQAFQTRLKELAARGVVLAVASKNNPEDARAPFEQHPDMVLALDDLAAFEAGWEPKDRMLRRIADQLRLGLESFVFFDDNPAERERIRQALPEVTVVDVPADPAGYVRALVRSLAFESTAVTAEDRARAADYRADHARRVWREERHDADDPDSLMAYLRSLRMVGDVRPIDDADLPRVIQLLAKTNQWNLTTRRHGEPQVRALLAQPRSIGLSLRLEDRFASSGLVAVLLAAPHDRRTLRIDSWLMSCRVIGRTVEHFLFAALVTRARDLGYRRLLGEHIPTAKNKPVSGWYEALGFVPEDAEEGVPGRRLTLELEGSAMPATAVNRRVEEPPS